MDLIAVYDCKGSNLSKFPTPRDALLAAYVTGAGDVPWNENQLAAHPDAARIDQSPVNTPADMLADVLDVERGAATLADIPGWVHGARTAYDLATRPGQRRPAIYCARSTVTPVANTLVAAGIPDNVRLWVAEQMSAAEATALLEKAGGPYPIIGIQYEFNELYDVSLVSAEWLNTRSVKPRTPAPGPGTQTGWRHCRKCKALFYGPEEAISHCPVGAQHDGSQSHEYTLGFAK